MGPEPWLISAAEMKHEAALLEYAVALLDRSMPEDAIKILLQQIVTKSEDKVFVTAAALLGMINAVLAVCSACGRCWLGHCSWIRIWSFCM